MEINIDPDHLRACRVWIATPAYGGQSYVAHFMSVMQLCLRLREYGVASSVHYLPNDSLITRARNNLTDMFMHGWENQSSENDFMLWIDGDVIFSPNDVVQMVSIMADPQYDILAAPYSRKGIHLDRVAEAARANWPPERILSVAGDPNVNWITVPVSVTEPQPLLEAGTGFLLIRRKVYEQMRDQMPELTYNRTRDEANTYGRDTCVAYFQDGIEPEGRTFISEDWFFCRNWIKLGGTIFGCMWIKTGHIGTYTYPMDMPAIAELLDATGGYINGPARTEEKTNAQVSKKDAALNPGRDIVHALVFVLGGSRSPGTAVPSD
jgi:hypothetical protein